MLQNIILLIRLCKQWFIIQLNYHHIVNTVDSTNTSVVRYYISDLGYWKYSVP